MIARSISSENLSIKPKTLDKIKLNREELYDLAWSTPVTILAKQFEITPTRIKSECKVKKIPMPEQGLWERKKHGNLLEIPELTIDISYRVNVPVSIVPSENNSPLVIDPDTVKVTHFAGNFSDTSFRQIDITVTKSIPVNSKNAKLISEHPSGSYEFIRDKDKKIESLEIKDPALFWKISKYAVVLISK